MTVLWDTGDQRLVLEVDTDTDLSIAEDDGSTPVLAISAGLVSQVTQITNYKALPEPARGLQRLLSDHRPRYEKALRIWERWMRLCYGMTTQPVALPRWGVTYLSYVDADWREFTGAPEDTKPDMTDLAAVLNGEVYYAELQERETWVGQRTGKTRDTWETVDSVGGLIGEWAEAAAVEHFPKPE